jgi:hypothetical protein
MVALWPRTTFSTRTNFFRQNCVSCDFYRYAVLEPWPNGDIDWQTSHNDIFSPDSFF